MFHGLTQGLFIGQMSGWAVRVALETVCSCVFRNLPCDALDSVRSSTHFHSERRRDESRFKWKVWCKAISLH